MERLISTPSVGGVIKKMVAINPALTAQDLIGIVRMCVERKDNNPNDGFSKLEIVNEAMALELTRETLKQ